MVAFAFKLVEGDLERAKRQAGLIPLGKIIRILVLKWMDKGIEITETDVEKYS